MMYRKLLLMSVALLFSSLLKSQILIALLFGDKLNSPDLTFGLNLGTNTSFLSNTPESRLNYGFQLGLFFDIRINDWFYLRPEVSPVYPLGARKAMLYETGIPNVDGSLDEFEVSREISYIPVLLLTKYRIVDHFFFELGPQISLRTKAYDIFYAEEIGDGLTYENDLRDEMRRIDVGLTGGFSYALGKDKAMNIGLRYYQGFLDIYKKDTEFDGASDQGVWNSNVNVFVGIPIGAGKGKNAPVEEQAE